MTDTDDETVTVGRDPVHQLVKTADSATYSAGDVVTYTFTTTNTGTTTLSDVEVSDTGLTGLSALSCDPGAGDPGAGCGADVYGDEDDVPG